MIRRLRTRHRWALAIIAVGTVVVYLVAVLQYAPPRRSPIPAALQPAGPPP